MIPEAGDAATGKKPRSGTQNREGARRSVIWLQDGGFVVRPGRGGGRGFGRRGTIVVADNLAEGEEVVIGEETQSAQAGTLNPFVPQIRKR